MSLVEVVVPVREAPPVAALTPAERRADLRGARLVLVANGKPRARELLELLGEELRGALGLGAVETVEKSGASTPLSPEESRRIAGSADLALTGLGDCGACSACSLHDALQLERLGLPAALVMTDVFGTHVASFSASLGAPGHPTVVVPHPVSSRDDETLRALAREALPGALAALTAPAADRA